MSRDDTKKAKGDASESLSSFDSSSSTETTVPAEMSEVRRRHFLKKMVENLPDAIQKRVTVLKNVQVEHLKMQAQFEREVLELQMKYAKLLQPVYEKRKEILTGEFEPPKELPKWKSQEMNDPLDAADLQALESYKPIMAKLIDMPADSKGIPNFWLTVLLSTSVSESVTENDEPALKKLKDIRCVYGPQLSFTLEFHFGKNDYFSNEVLTKQYFRKCTVDDDSPFGFEGAEITHCKGCEIEWKPGKNLITKTLCKKDGGRSAVTHIKTESFFNFFAPPNVALDDNCINEEDAINLSLDFEMADFLRMEIIPKAVLYYSGEIVEESDEEDNDSDDESSDTSEAAGDKKSVSAAQVKKGSTVRTEKGLAVEDANCNAE